MSYQVRAVPREVQGGFAGRCEESPNPENTKRPTLSKENIRRFVNKIWAAAISTQACAQKDTRIRAKKRSWKPCTPPGRGARKHVVVWSDIPNHAASVFYSSSDMEGAGTTFHMILCATGPTIARSAARGYQPGYPVPVATGTEQQVWPSPC